jgi:hypothetical protein
MTILKGLPSLGKHCLVLFSSKVEKNQKDDLGTDKVLELSKEFFLELVYLISRITISKLLIHS